MRLQEEISNLRQRLDTFDERFQQQLAARDQQWEQQLATRDQQWEQRLREQQHTADLSRQVAIQALQQQQREASDRAAEDFQVYMREQRRVRALFVRYELAANIVLASICYVFDHPSDTDSHDLPDDLKKIKSLDQLEKHVANHGDDAARQRWAEVQGHVLEAEKKINPQANNRTANRSDDRSLSAVGVYSNWARERIRAAHPKTIINRQGGEEEATSENIAQFINENLHAGKNNPNKRLVDESVKLQTWLLTQLNAPDDRPFLL